MILSLHSWVVFAYILRKEIGWFSMLETRRAKIKRGLKVNAINVTCGFRCVKSEDPIQITQC